MKKLLQALETKILVFILAGFLLGSIHSNAQGSEDSCLAMMLITPDHFDPLLIHFTFIGNVPINSFQFLGTWDFGDGNTSTDSCPNHQYSQPGTYTVCLSFSICIGGGLSCHDDTCETVFFGAVAQIENIDGSLNTFYSYPNPVSNQFHVRADSNKELSLKITDVSGRTVMNRMVRNDEPIDATGFSNGIYFMEVTDGTRTLTRKLTIQQ
ncbi:hypothetical protein BH11BAC1_BH11BAC1_16150 [soil metagenome]